MSMRLRLFLLTGTLIGVCVVAWPYSPSSPPPSVFDLPQLQNKTAALFQSEDYAEAERVCQTAVRLAPYDATARYNLACAQARQGKTDEALDALEKAVDLGFNNPTQLEQDDDLASLREQERFQKMLAYSVVARRTPKQPWLDHVEATPVENATVTVDEKNTVWDSRLGIFRSFFKLDETSSDSGPIADGFGEIGELLNTWQTEGTAAGNRGDLYDNHDADHSNMKYGAFPQFTRIEFAGAPKSRRLHFGLQTTFLYNGTTIGNSSTSLTSGPFWRSQPRLALTNPRTAALLYVQYRSNHLYVYPEHRDHDPGHNRNEGGGFGDVYSSSTPYLIISQGSSGSDRVFLNALAATLAAFRPEVKTKLARAGALMLTVQMIFRSCNKPVASQDDYLTGKAHPTVFEGSQLDALKMVEMAHEITEDALPPLIQLRVVREDQAVPGRDFFTAGGGERLFDTPCAVARVVRTTQYNRRMVVSAEPSADLNDRPLTYHWSVLRGDADRIRINKLNDSGSIVELVVPYHERQPIEPESPLASNRVDIGAFVHNGKYYSAPAFVTFFYLDNERRVYDAQQRISVVDYADPQFSKNYVDPVIDAPKQWRDEYHYDADGQLTGWTRIRGESTEQFTADGLLVTKTDAQGKPTEARRVRYIAAPRPKQPPIVVQQETDEIVEID